MLPERKSRMPVWWLLSICINAAALVILSVAAVTAENRTVEVVVEGERLNDVVGQLRAYHAAVFARKAMEVRDVLVAMDAKRRRKFDQLAAKVGSGAADALAPQVEADRRLLGDPAATADRLARRTIPEVFAAAAEFETRAARAYGHIRAATMGLIRGAPIDAAMPETAAVDAVPRDPLDVGILTRPIYRPSEYERFTQEIRKAERQLDTMIVAAKTHLARVQRQEDLEDAGKVSLTMVESSRGAATAGGALLPWEIYDTGSPLGHGGVNPVPGRKLSSAGSGFGEWMFVDTWHIVGPFDNARRDNLNMKFLPETVVDLDAVYPSGKGGQTVRWQYVRSPKVCVDPPHAARYAIWYAAAEIFVEREDDYWVATGGDDFCKFWVNDELVWVSGETPKPYYAFEHIQQIHFKRGVNRLLFRIENAGGLVGFSVLIYVQ